MATADAVVALTACPRADARDSAAAEVVVPSISIGMFALGSV
jgi:hypothetical protein